VTAGLHIIGQFKRAFFRRRSNNLAMNRIPPVHPAIERSCAESRRSRRASIAAISPFSPKNRNRDDGDYRVGKPSAVFNGPAPRPRRRRWIFEELDDFRMGALGEQDLRPGKSSISLPPV
jgi:hypothetical protein